MIHVDIFQLPSLEPRAAMHNLPPDKGIYFWFNKNSNELIYIGIATGNGGLKKRILSQHLNPKYLECRASKQSPKDHFQLEHSVKKINTKGLVVFGIDKSVLRKKIGRKYLLKPGDETVSFLLESCYLKVFTSTDIMLIKSYEKALVESYRPEFNSTHKI